MDMTYERLKECSRRLKSLYPRTASSAHAVLSARHCEYYKPYSIFLLGHPYNIDGLYERFETLTEMEYWLDEYERQRDILFRKFEI